ncbi:hypothetical protein [Labilibaculum euxinus]|uniref:DUF3137 domain-containing protein n=1 Tax=Labilibaculum euxinus TaxID=2686357 RepID=A0A7M4D7L6_9BACT|nr:hypothetical protein [Labilibaculum euxinus]MUP38645.1 hypothetical protein [Labilibaculum euxinus]MVB07850.1 hypothetical protein [Labilibaculum euxinus]
MKNKKEDSILQTVIKGPSYGYTDNYSIREMWNEIANEYKGEFRISHNSGYELEIQTVKIPYKKWIFTITISDTRPLKISTAGFPLQEFELLISWEDFIERIIKKFGKPEIELGNPDFDKKYLIKSDRPELVVNIFTPEVQKIFLKNNIYSFSYQTKRECEKAEILSVISRKVEDKELVKEIIKAHQLIIDNLEALKVFK